MNKKPYFFLIGLLTTVITSLIIGNLTNWTIGGLIISSLLAIDYSMIFKELAEKL